MDNKKNVMCQEEYDWNKKEHLKHKNNPYMFSNEDLAVEYYQRIKRSIRMQASIIMESSNTFA